MNNVRGQPTSPKSTGVSSTHLAGVGRARLHAEARKKNFGGVSFSPPKTSGIDVFISIYLFALRLKHLPVITNILDLSNDYWAWKSKAIST